VALLVGLGANTVYRWVRQPSPEESRKTLLQQTAITLLVAIAVRVLLGAIFRTPSGSDTGYLNVIAPIAVLKELVPGNLNYYIDISKDFIPGFQWVFLSKLFWMSLVWCSLAGFLRKVRSGPQFSEFFVLPYLAMISAWPFLIFLPTSTSGFGKRAIIFPSRSAIRIDDCGDSPLSLRCSESQCRSSPAKTTPAACPGPLSNRNGPAMLGWDLRTTAPTMSTQPAQQLKIDRGLSVWDA